MIVELDLDSSAKMINLLLIFCLIQGLEIGEIIPFPVYIISFPVYKAGFGPLSKDGNNFVKEIIWSDAWKIGAIIPFPVWIIYFPICKTGF